MVSLIEDLCVSGQRPRTARPQVEERRGGVAHDGVPRVARDVGVRAGAVRATRVPVAAEVDVALSLYGVEAEEL